MYEVEIKVRAEKEPVRRRLEALSASPQETVIQEDTYYDAPHRSFAETDEALRIRREHVPEAGETKIKVTYKGPLVDETTKTREEIETPVQEGEKFAAIFEQLGFEPAATVHKEREQFELEGYTVTLDTVEGLGEFVEVETEATEGELDRAREGAFALLEKLELEDATRLRTSYLGLLLAERA